MLHFFWRITSHLPWRGGVGEGAVGSCSEFCLFPMAFWGEDSHRWLFQRRIYKLIVPAQDAHLRIGWKFSTSDL